MAQRRRRCTRCRRRSPTWAPRSAATARRASSCTAKALLDRDPRPEPRRDRRGAVAATCAAAPATCRSSRRSRAAGACARSSMRRPERRATAPTTAASVRPRAVTDRHARLGSRRVDGRAKVTGQTRFADDLTLPRMLHCKLLRSTVPHARIARHRHRRRRGAPRRQAGPDRRRLPDPLRHPRRSARTSTRCASTACASSAIRWPPWSPRRVDRREALRPDRASSTSRCATIADPRRRSPRPSRASTTTARTATSTSASRSSSATWTPASPRPTASSRTSSSTGQHPPADRAARHAGRRRSRRQAARLLVDADAALPAPRAGQGRCGCRRRTSA